MRIFAEAKRRGVLKVATVYLAVSWLTLEVGHTLFNIFELPHLGLQIVFVLLTLGFPGALAMGWFHHTVESSDALGTHDQPHHEGEHLAAVFGAVALLVLAVAIGLRFFHNSQTLGHDSHTAARGHPASGESEASAPRSGGRDEASVVPAFDPPPHSVAVLPFANLSGDPKEDYFSDGLSEELLNSLTRVQQLRVPARTSSFSFKGTNTDIQSIARKLNVGAVLEGSVRKAGDQVRITAQLIDAKTGYHRWSQTYDRNLRDILALESEIAEAVTRASQVTLLGDPAATFELGGTQNPQAFDAYLHGLMQRERTEKPNMLAGIAAFEEAVRFDPNYALAYAARAEILATFAMNFSDHPRDDFRRAKSSAQQAIKLAPSLAEAHAALGRVLDFGDLDFAAAQREFDIALKLAPGSAIVHANYALFAAWLGRPGAIDAARRAVRLDPVSADTYRILIRALYYSGQYEKVIAGTDPQGRTFEGLLGAYAGYANLALGRNEAAAAACTKEPVVWAGDHCLAIAYHRLGRFADAQAALKRLQDGNGDSAAYQYAEIHAQWGHPDEAVRWLQKAFELRDPGLVALNKDVFLNPIENRPEFQKILAALRYPD